MYKPHRDSRFEYLWDAMEYVEDTQCRSCQFRLTTKDSGTYGEEYPMCPTVSGKFLLEQPIEEIDDLGSDGLRCNLRKPLEVS